MNNNNPNVTKDLPDRDARLRLTIQRFLEAFWIKYGFTRYITVLCVPVLLALTTPGPWWLFSLAGTSAGLALDLFTHRGIQKTFAALEQMGGAAIQKALNKYMAIVSLLAAVYCLPWVALAWSHGAGPLIGLILCGCAVLPIASLFVMTRHMALIMAPCPALGLALNAMALAPAGEKTIGLGLAGLMVVTVLVLARAGYAGFEELINARLNAESAAETLEERVRQRTAELLEATQAAESANRAKSAFLANMSHELRTPLNAIIGYSEMLYEDACDDEREAAAHDLNRVLLAAKSLLVIINDILDLSKIEAGRMDLSISDFDIGRMVKEAVETIRPQAEKNGNVLSVVVDAGLDTGRSDAFKLSQCLLNLLSNAAKFTKDGRIKVHAQMMENQGANWLQISVSDTGIGLNEEQIARLFQPFVQADSSFTKEYGGTGLGLVITQRILHLLGGEILLSSVHGKGSTFTICVPLRIGAEQATFRDDALNAVSHNDGPGVLVIDDDADVAELVQRSIGGLGFSVVSARTGKAGLSAAKNQTPALILLDISLPDHSGWLLLEALTTASTTRNIPIIVHSVDDDRQRSNSLGACAHFVKPTDREALAAAIARFARKKDEIATATTSAAKASPLAVAVKR